MAANLDLENTDDNAPRGDFNLLGIKKDRKPKTKMFMVIGAGVLFLFVAIGGIFFAAFKAIDATNPNKVDESKVKADAALQTKSISDDDIQKKREQILQKRQQEQKKQEESEPKVLPENKAQPAVPEPSAAYLRKLSGGVIVQENRGESNQVSPSREDDRAGDESKAPDTAANAERAKSEAGSDETFEPSANNARGNLSQLQGTSYATTKAYLSPNRKFLLKRKSSVRCALYTAVKTDHPGFVKCILTQPLYSSDGSVIIAETGAELDGEQRVEIKQGQSSVFTIWNDLETTVGVRASLNALGTGAMGESGTEAYVDNHNGQRYGGAVMLSFIQDAFASAANATKRNNSTYSFDNSENNAENMASKALENSINIPPTGYVLPGTVINVIVAQDVDFSSVFKTKKGR